MPFPIPPFKLNKNKKCDFELLKYLQDKKNFNYLSKDVYEKIKAIKINEKNPSMQNHQQILINLWPSILTDALLKLKQKDSREWDNKNKNMHTFFDENSIGTDELKEIFLGFSEFEGIMYGALPNNYRDHITHSFRVWIIGQGLLNECLENKLSIYEKFKFSISKDEWSCMWTIIALCHDVGYPLSQIEKINLKAKHILKKQGLQAVGDMNFSFSNRLLPFHETIIKLMASKSIKIKKNKFATHLQNKYYLKLLKSFDKLDHGIISSLLISNALIYFLESDFLHDDFNLLDTEDCRQFLIRREILRAIASHTCQDIYHLQFNTLSFLLYIIDDIQCWGRPTFQELYHDSVDISEEYVEIKEFDVNKINIIITTLENKWSKEQQEHIALHLSKLKKMLRLAVDTPKLIKKHFLRFEVKNSSRQSCLLELKDGEIIFKKFKLNKNESI